MSFKLSNLAKAEKSIDVREIDIHLTEVLRLIDPYDLAPALASYNGFMHRTFEPLQRREIRANFRVK